MPFPNIPFPHPSSCMLQNMYEQDGGTAVRAPAVVAPAAVAPAAVAPPVSTIPWFNWWCTKCTGVHDTECMCCEQLTRHPLMLIHQKIAAPTPPPMAAAAERQAPVESAEAKATYDPERPMIMYSDGTARPAPIRHPTSAEYERSQGSYDRLMDFNAQSNRDREDMRLEQKRLEWKESGRDAPRAVNSLSLPPTAPERHRIGAPLPPLEGMCLSLLFVA